MTQAGKDKVVTLSYNLTDPDGNMLDEGNEPIVYLHGGYDGVFIPIEDALDGKSSVIRHGVGVYRHNHGHTTGNSRRDCSP